MRISDWSSDVCSSDLRRLGPWLRPVLVHRRRARHGRPLLVHAPAGAVLVQEPEFRSPPTAPRRLDPRRCAAVSLRSSLTSFDDTIDFRKVWRYGTTTSLLVLLIAIWGLVGPGLNLGLDFEGGTSWDVPGASLSVDDTRDALRPAGQDGAKIQVIGRGDNRVVRVQSDLDEVDTQTEVTAALAEVADVDEGDITVSTVGPSWGEQVTDKAVRALVWFFIAIALYIAWRLEWRMAVGARASVAQDLAICVGFYAGFQIEVTRATVIAFLTTPGSSLNATMALS